MSRAPFQVLVLPWRRRDTLEVAIFHRADHDIWQFVSGGGEDDETPELAARREGHEEAAIPRDAEYTRLDAMAMLPACWFGAWPTWPDTVLVVPEHVFAVEIADHVLEISDEHLELCWCPWREAMARLKFDSNRTALWELHERLFPGPRAKRFAYK